MARYALLVAALFAVAASVYANVEDDFTAAEQKELDRLLAKKETRARRATADPTLETASGNIVLAVDNGKKVGYKVGGDTLFFNDLPKQYQADDNKCFSALKIGYELGQSSPSTNGMLTLLNNRVADDTANLSKAVDVKVDVAIAKVDAGIAKLSTENAKCSGKGMAVSDKGQCVAAPWVLATDASIACTSDNTGALRYSKSDSKVLVCGSDKKWKTVSADPPLGAYKTSPAKTCTEIKKAQTDVGNKLYWLQSGSSTTLIFCDMSGSGVPIGDGSTKTMPAQSCAGISSYYGKVTTTAAKFYVKSGVTVVQVVCVMSRGSALQFGDGKIKEFPAASCQSILTNFGGLKTGDSRYLADGLESAKKTCTVSKDGKTAYTTKDGSSAAQAVNSCSQHKIDEPKAASGMYYVKLAADGKGTPTPYRVYCDMVFKGGGWTMIYNNHISVRSATEWKLSYADTTTKGKRFQEVHKGVGGPNYLMPVRFWSTFSGGTLILRSEQADNSRAMQLNGWTINPADSYRWNWKSNTHPSSSEINAMNHHKGHRLSTVDKDHDNWSQSCAVHGGTFGWFNQCCNLCMTSSSDGGWRNKGRSGANIPVDWSYRGTNWMIWYIKK